MDNHPPTFVVLGATGGIGSELCRHLARDGATPVLAARDEGRLKELAGELDAPYRAVDATDGGAVNDLFSTTARENGPIAGAVNCVGTRSGFAAGGGAPIRNRSAEASTLLSSFVSSTAPASSARTIR